MKATGIIRRIDDLGRIVIPREIRKQLKIGESDPLEIFLSRDGEIILKPYRTDYILRKADNWEELEDPQGKVVATGYARETVSKSPINKFAFVENAETSAWGRALGNFGIGVDTAICSAEELLQKISQEEIAKVELAIDDLQKGEIDSCRSKEELVKVCQRISKELGKDEPKYRKSLVKAYNTKLEDLEA